MDRLAPSKPRNRWDPSGLASYNPIRVINQNCFNNQVEGNRCPCLSDGWLHNSRTKLVIHNRRIIWSHSEVYGAWVSQSSKYIRYPIERCWIFLFNEGLRHTKPWRSTPRVSRERHISLTQHLWPFLASFLELLPGYSVLLDQPRLRPSTAGLKYSN